MRPGMSARDAFGPNLRRQRIQRGVTLEQIAEATKVSVSLWAGLERNDLSRWPNGIYARSYIRTYALAIGADPEATVDEFAAGSERRSPCRSTIREHRRIVGHALAWQRRTAGCGPRGTGAPLLRRRPPSGERSNARGAFGQVFGRLRRAIDRA